MKKIILLLVIFTYSCTTRNMDEVTQNRLNTLLDSLVVIDQIAAYPPSQDSVVKYGKDIAYKKHQLFSDKVLHSNYLIIQCIFSTYGYLDSSKIGPKGENKFWLLVQHFDFDPNFQNKVLKKINKAVIKKTGNPSNYAYLRDRVNVNTNKKQIFGTQMSSDDGINYYIKNGLVDSINVDKRRKEYMLEPLKEYLNSHMKVMHEMNSVNNPNLPLPNYY